MWKQKLNLYDLKQESNSSFYDLEGFDQSENSFKRQLLEMPLDFALYQVRAESTFVDWLYNKLYKSQNHDSFQPAVKFADEAIFEKKARNLQNFPFGFLM
jgi:hypothetical protein